MSTAPAPEVNFDAPTGKPKKTKAKAKKTARAAPAAKSTVQFPGLTRGDCSSACGPSGCAIGTSYCSHPCKGGLQSPDKGKPHLLKNIQKAMSQIDIRLDPKRFQD